MYWDAFFGSAAGVVAVLLGLGVYVAHREAKPRPKPRTIAKLDAWYSLGPGAAQHHIEIVAPEDGKTSIAIDGEDQVVLGHRKVVKNG